MEITLRAYQKEDFPALKNIIQETWHYDDFSSPKVASKLANVFLSSCLTNYTYSCVALLDNQIVGIILGKHIPSHRCSIKNKLRQLKAIVSLYISREGRKVAKIFEDASKIDQQLLKSCNKRYDGELALFAVSSVCRNKGIGKKLFTSFFNYMAQQKVKEFYLFTDTSCNYGFYKHQGMARRCTKDHHFYIQGQKETIRFFIYDYSMQKKSSN